MVFTNITCSVCFSFRALLFVFWECSYSIYFHQTLAGPGTSKEGHLTPEKHLVGGWTMLNQPIWKICSSNWKSSPIFGVKILETTTLGTLDTQRILFENVHFLLNPHPPRVPGSAHPLSRCLDTGATVPSFSWLQLRFTGAAINRFSKKNAQKYRRIRYFRLIPLTETVRNEGLSWCIGILILKMQCHPGGDWHPARGFTSRSISSMWLV